MGDLTTGVHEQLLGILVIVVMLGMLGMFSMIVQSLSGSYYGGERIAFTIIQGCIMATLAMCGFVAIISCIESISYSGDSIVYAIDDTVDVSIDNSIDDTIDNSIDDTIDDSIDDTVDGSTDDTIDGSTDDTIDDTKFLTMEDTIYIIIVLLLIALIPAAPFIIILILNIIISIMGRISESKDRRRQKQYIGQHTIKIIVNEKINNNLIKSEYVLKSLADNIYNDEYRNDKSYTKVADIYKALDLEKANIIKSVEDELVRVMRTPKLTYKYRQTHEVLSKLKCESKLYPGSNLYDKFERTSISEDYLTCLVQFYQCINHEGKYDKTSDCTIFIDYDSDTAYTHKKNY